MKFTLYPIHWLAEPFVDDEEFDRTRLPFEITDGIRIEEVSDWLQTGEFDLWKERVGSDATENLEGIRYAIVDRYDPRPIIANGEVIGEEQHDSESIKRVRLVAACLRIIRPMRERAAIMRGKVRDRDGTFDVGGFDLLPFNFIEVPEVQKLFKLRNQDVDDLRVYAPKFLRAMLGEFWKFRMSVQFHELGHSQSLDWKARYLLWCSAIESIYTSHNWEHQGSLVATSRIKWFLGERTSIYAPGDISSLLTDPQITLGQIVGDLYEMRNLLAHGDKIPDPFFTDTLRIGINGGVQKREVLLEAASFIIRASLLKILRDGLLDQFADAAPAEAFFGARGLTKSALRARRP